jgi:hypothetical protein
MPVDRSAPIEASPTGHHDAGICRARPPSRPLEDVLADAIRVLTEAARLTRPLPEREAATPAPGPPVSVRYGRGPTDWAEFVTHHPVIFAGVKGTTLKSEEPAKGISGQCALSSDGQTHRLSSLSSCGLSLRLYLNCRPSLFSRLSHVLARLFHVTA